MSRITRNYTWQKADDSTLPFSNKGRLRFTLSTLSNSGAQPFLAHGPPSWKNPVDHFAMLTPQ